MKPIEPKLVLDALVLLAAIAVAAGTLLAGM